MFGFPFSTILYGNLLMALLQLPQWLLLAFCPKILRGDWDPWMVLYHSLNIGWVVGTLKPCCNQILSTFWTRIQWGLETSFSHSSRKSHFAKLSQHLIFLGRKFRVDRTHLSIVYYFFNKPACAYTIYQWKKCAIVSTHSLFSSVSVNNSTQYHSRHLEMLSVNVRKPLLLFN